MLDLRNLQRLNVSKHTNINKVVYIFDTAAFLAALQLHIYVGEIVTTPSVVQEVKDSESMSKLEIALIIERFRVESPDHKYMEKVKNIAKSLKLLDKLSQADIEVMALAFQYKDKEFEPVVFTDDYDVQSILKFIGIKFKPVKNIGIDKSSAHFR